MIQESTKIKDLFFNCLNSLSETPWLFTNQSGDFFQEAKDSILCETLEISIKDFFENEESNKSIFDDPLIKSVYRLSSNQRYHLKCFLDSIRDVK